MTIQEAYTSWASTYDDDRNRTRDLDADVTRMILMGRRFRQVLELGCGTGKNTVFLAAIADRVHSLDFSEGMIARAREKVTAPSVSFTVADLTLPWPQADTSIDLIVCNLVLEHIADLQHIFAESSRVLADDGTLFLSELHPFRQYQGTKANFARANSTIEIPSTVHHLSDFTEAGRNHRFAIERLQEWWHTEDENLPPRLVSLLFVRQRS